MIVICEIMGLASTTKPYIYNMSDRFSLFGVLQLPCVQQCFVSSLRDCGPTRYIGKYMEISRDGLY